MHLDPLYFTNPLMCKCIAQIIEVQDHNMKQYVQKTRGLEQAQSAESESESEREELDLPAHSGE